MFRIIETMATAIMLILIMIFVLHLIQGDAWEWLLSKFQVENGDVLGKAMENFPHRPSTPPNIPNDPLPPPPPNQG